MGKSSISENNVKKEALRKKYLKDIEQDLDELKKKQPQSHSLRTSDKEAEIRFKIELIEYLTAELANTKAELMRLKQSTKELP
ncbi:MAG: hypothetical protein ABSA75_15500 [Candidatus Bathyarchaeia archaeon]|jgi:ABC-type uncharacterized transport system substrate-binding protein